MPRQEDYQPGLAAAIRFFRQRSEMTQVDLGTRAGIHPTWISHIESGRINPTWGNIRRIAAGLEIALGELADGAQRNERDPITLKTRPGPPALPRTPTKSKRSYRRQRNDDPGDWVEDLALRDRAE